MLVKKAVVAHRVRKNPDSVRIDEDLDVGFLVRILNGLPVASLHVHTRFLAARGYLPNLRFLSLHGECPRGFSSFSKSRPDPLEGLRVLVLTGIRHIEEHELVHLIRRLERNCPHLEELYVRGPLGPRAQKAWQDFEATRLDDRQLAWDYHVCERRGNGAHNFSHPTLRLIVLPGRGASSPPLLNKTKLIEHLIEQLMEYVH